jgi:hypothetical protein
MFSNTPRPTVPIYADSLDFTAPADEVIKHRARRALEPFGRIELMSKFQDAMRRVITGDNVHGESVIIIDGGPSSKKGNPDLGEMFEIWEDAAFGALTPSAKEDLGATRPVLGPRKGNISRCAGS